jgi:hypothetical protein
VFPASWRAGPTSSGGGGSSTRCVRATHACWAAGAGWARWREAWAERGVARASWARVARGLELGWRGVARASWARRAAGSWAGTGLARWGSWAGARAATRGGRLAWAERGEKRGKKGAAGPAEMGHGRVAGPLYLFLLLQQLFSLFFLFTPFDSN